MICGAAAIAVAPKKDFRYYLNGVLYDHADRCWVATDGYCLIRTPDGTTYTIAPAANAGQGDPFDMVEMKR